MPRLPRPDLAGIAQHVVQRGNDRQTCFYQPDDYAVYLARLGECAARCGVAIHAYVLMGNHVHLLVTPGDKGGVSRMMQQVGRGYVPYVNARYRRTGTLWEGRFKACLVAGGDYVLACYRYIELNPVRAGMVDAPREYRWSSHRATAYGRVDSLLTPHEEYLRLAPEADSRAAAYRALCAEVLSEAQLRRIRGHLGSAR